VPERVHPTVEGSFAFTAALRARGALRGSHGSPSFVVNPYGVGCHIEPALSRSAICLARMSRSDAYRQPRHAFSLYDPLTATTCPPR
jgi:hypothetical protein